MKSSMFLTVAAAVFAMANPTPEAAEGDLLSELTPRACTSTSCKCTGIPNGLFCGDGLLGCKKGNVYQCGGDGKLSCNYGVRKSCQKCNKLSC